MTFQPSKRTLASTPSRSARALALVAVAAVVVVACEPAPPPVATPTPVAASTAVDPGPVMGRSRLSAAQLAAWFKSMKISGTRPPESIDAIARYYIEEGKREGIAGDVAFVQAILETGWFRFSARMPPSHFNFSGIGAVDSGTSSAKFANSRTGVRAQIQHLRAYADPKVNCKNFATPTVTPRCQYVKPKGKAPNWRNMGKGNWATDPAYATKIANLYGRAVAHARAAAR